jgi:predicted permease
VPHVDWRIVRNAATAGLLVVIPAAVVAQAFADDTDDGSGWALVFFAVTVLGFVIAGFAAGRLRSDTPMAHGATAAAVTWAVVQLFGTARRLLADEPVSWLAIAFAGMLAVSAGVAGGAFADWFRRRVEPRVAHRQAR